MDFNQTVRIKARERKLKINKLAKLSGISYAYLMDLLRERRRWNTDTMQAVCKIIGVKIVFIDQEEPSRSADSVEG